MHSELQMSRARADDISTTKGAEKRLAQQTARREMDLLVRREYEERVALQAAAFRSELDVLTRQLEEALRGQRQQESDHRELLRSMKVDFFAKLKTKDETIDQLRSDIRSLESSCAEHANEKSRAMSVERQVQMKVHMERLEVQLACVLTEVRQAEYERKVHDIESQEALKLAAQSARESMSLRRELDQLKLDYNEATGKIEELKAEKEQEGASFAIARTGFVHAAQRKHMKALDAVVEHHRNEKQKQQEELRQLEEEMQEKHRQELSAVADAKRKEVAEVRMLEEQRRAETQEHVQAQMFDTFAAKEQSIKDKYEQALSAERESHAAAMLQMHLQLDARAQQEIEEAKSATQTALSGMLEERLKDLKTQLELSSRRYQVKTAELDWIISKVQVIDEQMLNLTHTLPALLRASFDRIHDLDGVVQQQNLRVSDLERALQESEHRALSAETEMKRAMLTADGREHVLHSMMRNEFRSLEKDVNMACQWHLRAQALKEELEEALMRQNALQRKVREDETKAAAELNEARLAFAAEQSRLEYALEDAQKDKQLLKNRYEMTEAEGKRTHANLEEIRHTLTEKEIEFKYFQREFRVRTLCLKAELRREDDGRKQAERMENARMRKLLSAASTTEKVLARELGNVDSQLVRMERKASQRVVTMGSELSWHRQEILKARNQVDEMRGRAEAAEMEASHSEDKFARLKAKHDELVGRYNRDVKEYEAKTELQMTTLHITNDTLSAALAAERELRGDDKSTIEGLTSNVEALKRELHTSRLEADDMQLKLESALVRVNDEHHAAEVQLKQRLESLQPRFTAVQGDLHILLENSQSVVDALDEHDSKWQSLVSCKEQQYDMLLLDIDALQLRHDWLLTRWAAREPREEDVRMISALQDELSRQMHMTAQSVQSARQYKEALRSNDKAYTHIFGMGATLPGDVLISSAKLEEDLSSSAPRKINDTREQVGYSTRSCGYPESTRLQSGGRASARRRQPVRKLTDVLPEVDIISGPRPESARTSSACKLDDSTRFSTTMGVINALSHRCQGDECRPHTATPRLSS